MTNEVTYLFKKLLVHGRNVRTDGLGIIENYRTKITKLKRLNQPSGKGGGGRKECYGFGGNGRVPYNLTGI